MKRTTSKPMAAQVKKRVSQEVKKKPERDGNTELMVSTGSTLLDLAISGGRVRGGGLPGGIMVEIFGPSGVGKTVLLSEIAGAIRRKKGEVMFHDPEGRLNNQFASIFGLNIDDIDYAKTNTIPEVFSRIRKWNPKGTINGIMADSLAALSTDLEMGKDEGDKMGMRRAKEFSEELRKTARIISGKDLILVCSNQLRINVGGGDFAPKYTTPGGEAIGYYASLRLRMRPAAKDSKVKRTAKIQGKEETRIEGVTVEIEVAKSSIDKPHRKAPVTIIFDYGIDDIRQNLKFLKKYTGSTVYSLGENKLSNSLDGAIEVVEDAELSDELREAVIDLWEEIEEKFKTERKPKQR